MLSCRGLLSALTIIVGLASSAGADDQQTCQQANRDEAIAACTRIITAGNVKGQELAWTYQRRGIKYYTGGDHDLAISDFEAAIRLNPNFARAYAQRGWVYYLKHDYDRAIADADTAIRLNPKVDFFYTNRAAAWQAKGDANHAIADYDQALRVNPNSMQAYFHRGVLRSRTSDYDNAIADFDAAVRLNSNLNPKLDYPYFFRGQARQAKGDYAGAVADYNSAIEINPKYVAAFNNRALLQEINGNLASALADFKSALAINPNLPNAPERIRRLEEKLKNAPQQEPAKAATPTVNDTRVALVVGNSAYAYAPRLPNPKGDAEKIAAKLKQIGFSNVTLKLDLTREQLLDALKTFAASAARADWALVYFAGHGIEFGGNNYLIPIDATLASDRDISFEAIPLDQVLLAVEGARKLRLVILDACRDNPFARTMSRSVGTRSVGRGLAQIEPEGATLVAYAAKHGQVAKDGESGANSPFVTALVKNLDLPGIEIGLFFRKVRDDVLAATGHLQEPYTYGSLPSEQLFFRHP